ncbi:MAG: hypothetical protein AAGE61_16815 [Pseudomonadota bacterium]
MLAYPFPAKAAKEVPTIRIEIPQDDSPNVDPSEPAVPGVPGGIIEDDGLFDEPLEFDEEEPQELEPAFDDESGKEKPRKVEVFYGEDKLPEPVKALRRKLIEAAHTGDIEALRPIIESFSQQTIVSFGDEVDPIEYLKSSSGDGDGVEILAILLDILESGYVHREEGEDGEIFIWPYFVDTPLANLTSAQMVELFRIVTAGDFSDMQAYGAYIFYRAGITPDGELKFFIAGD